jgi:hypothetical protein
VVASRDAIKQADKQLGGSAKLGIPNSRGTPLADPSGGTGSGSTAGSGSSAGGQIDGLFNNKKPTVKLPLPGGKSTKGSTSGGGNGSGTLSNLGDGLGDAVETLLPDVPGLPDLP